MNEALVHETGPAIRFEGMDVHVVVTSEHTCGSFSVVEYQLAAATLAAPIHKHTLEDIYVYVSAGELVVQLNGKIATVMHGQWVHIPRGMPQAMWSQPERPARYFEVSSPAGLERYITALGAIFAAGAPFEFETIRALEKQFGVETDYQSIFELTQVYQLRHDQRYHAICW
jgi:quercetin dioxygenase-like cupin family protein